MTISVRLPNWAFQASWFLCQLRHNYFQNQFANKKLREIHQHERYVEYVEGIIGYYGDIACAIYLGIDPKDMLITMVHDTQGMTRRDRFDLLYRANNVDVKIEDFNGFQEKVINGTIGVNEPYGCRLINQNQWVQNSESIDYYVFGCFPHAMSNQYKLHDVQDVLLLGYVSKQEISNLEISNVSPAGRNLWTPAKIIPHSTLHQMEGLRDVADGNRGFDINTGAYPNDRADYIITRLREIWS